MNVDDLYNMTTQEQDEYLARETLQIFEDAQQRVLDATTEESKERAEANLRSLKGISWQMYRIRTKVKNPLVRASHMQGLMLESFNGLEKAVNDLQKELINLQDTAKLNLTVQEEEGDEDESAR